MSNEQSSPAAREAVRWEIQHYAWCDDWVNAWTDSDENGEIPVTFATEEEAEDELREFLEERPDEDEEGYRVVPLDQHRCGEIAGITRDHGPGEAMFHCRRPATVVGKVEDVSVYLCAEHSRTEPRRVPN